MISVGIQTGTKATSMFWVFFQNSQGSPKPVCALHFSYVQTYGKFLWGLRWRQLTCWTHLFLELASSIATTSCWNWVLGKNTQIDEDLEMWNQSSLDDMVNVWWWSMTPMNQSESGQENKQNIQSVYSEHCGINMEFRYISRMFKWYIQYSACIVQNCSSWFCYACAKLWFLAGQHTQHSTCLSIAIQCFAYLNPLSAVDT